MPAPKKLLVVGAPRTGFSLLISVLQTLLNRFGLRPPRSNRQLLVNRVVELGSFYATSRYRATFADFGITRDLVFNGEFHLLVGGPKWLGPKAPHLACIRKYFGVRGLGDFLLVTSHPREVLDHDDILHSHTAPGLWAQQEGYSDRLRFASIRNPLGTINSACFSLNAMASEYIQKFMPEECEEHIRLRHGLYKLTDMEFFRGLVRFLASYLEDYLPWCERYSVMRWEDLITEPAKVIRRLAGELGVECGEEEARGLWAPLDHVNLLRFHKHNYRRGKGIVGDWKNSLVNEHVEVFREYGFERYLEALGYPPLPELRPRDYSPYQRLVARHIQRGEVYRDVGDPDLFGFAFNKTNIDASKFGFRSFPAGKWTKVERTTLKRDDVVEAVARTAEDCCEKINQLLFEALDARVESSDDVRDCLRQLRREWVGLMGEVPDGRGLALCHRLQEPLGHEGALL